MGRRLLMIEIPEFYMNMLQEDLTYSRLCLSLSIAEFASTVVAIMHFKASADIRTGGYTTGFRSGAGHTNDGSN